MPIPQDLKVRTDPTGYPVVKVRTDPTGYPVVKTCKTCGVEKPGTPDFWYITPKGVPYPNCKVCHMAITKQYKVDTRNAIREWRKEHPHGQLDAGQVRVLVEDYRAACRQREELKAQSSYRRRK